MAKRFWLLKTEPDCFSIDDLKRSPNQITSWSGVRNYQARNLLRDEIKVNDEVLFHHSSTAPIGIAGLCIVSRSGYPDPAQFNPNDEYFDPKASLEKPIWFTVDVKFQRKLNRLIPLTELKKTPGLEKMMVCQRGARLSVQPVTADEWEVIRKLIRRQERVT